MNLGKEFGIITLAIGDKYIEEAINLGLSLVVNSPNIPRAIVCDRTNDTRLLKYFDFIIPILPEINNPFLHKISMDLYTPFKKTMFLDADCLCYKDIFYAFSLFTDSTFGYVGRKAFDGIWYGLSIQALRTKLHVEYIPQLNSGMFYFTDSIESVEVFKTARQYYNSYENFNIPLFRKTFYPDEPAFSMALAQLGIAPTEDLGRTMRSTSNASKFELDINRGKCSLFKNGIYVHPSILHCSRKKGKMLYKREVFSLKSRNELFVPSFIRITVCILIQLYFQLEYYAARIMRRRKTI